MRRVEWAIAVVLISCCVVHLQVGDGLTISLTSDVELGSATISVGSAAPLVGTMHGSSPLTWDFSYTIETGTIPVGAISFSLSYTALGGGAATSTPLTYTPSITFGKCANDTLPDLLFIHWRAFASSFLFGTH